MDMELLRTHLDQRLDKLEDKLDTHLERIARSEEAISWLKGHVKIVTTIVLAGFGFVATALYNIIAK